ncbi:MAG: CPBP family intramembrane metalloprotease [Candidatus Hydrogenedentes bacterium]|nr:CPBP family intramembrane metalloprotease [Candidatus Hydrogenedentota bacterium]
MRWEYAIALFVGYIILDLGGNLLKFKWLSKFLGFSQFIILLVSIFYLLTHTIFPRNLMFVPTWLIGILVAHILYTCGLIFTSGRLQMAGYFFSLPKMVRFCFLSPLILSRTFSGAVIEEIIYRGFFQTIFANYFRSHSIAILIVAIGFLLVHKHIFNSSLIQNVEFFVFSIILGTLFYITNDLGLVVMIHFWRNMSTNYLDYLEKLEDNGDIEGAISELESQLSPWRIRKE